MNTHAALLVAVMAIVTMLLRFLPFLIFGGDRKTPPFILYLGKVLPEAVIAMLVIYCLREINVSKMPFGLPELIAGASTVLLQIKRRNSVLSILGGTAVYMLLIHFVF